MAKQENCKNTARCIFSPWWGWSLSPKPRTPSSYQTLVPPHLKKKQTNTAVLIGGGIVSSLCAGVSGKPGKLTRTTPSQPSHALHNSQKQILWSCRRLLLPQGSFELHRILLCRNIRCAQQPFPIPLGCCLIQPFPLQKKRPGVPFTAFCEMSAHVWCCSQHSTSKAIQKSAGWCLHPLKFLRLYTDELSCTQYECTYVGCNHILPNANLILSFCKLSINYCLSVPVKEI